MKKMFLKICVPLMLINNNVYTFISGILISLSTGMLTTLCLEKIVIIENMHLYGSAIMFLIAGALLIYVASRVTEYQNYIIAKKILDRKTQKSIIKDFESGKSNLWTLIFLLLILTIMLGLVLLFLNFIIK